LKTLIASKLATIRNFCKNLTLLSLQLK